MHTQTFNMHFIRNNQASLMHTCAGDRINYEKKKESCSNATCNHTIRSYRLVKRLKQNTNLVIHFFFIRVIVLRSDAIYSIKFMCWLFFLLEHKRNYETNTQSIYIHQKKSGELNMKRTLHTCIDSWQKHVHTCPQFLLDPLLLRTLHTR